eukprot:TRINITY_DN80395_c0_g1_i1.p1 TRINITY_DN80395_c0_g1~~TRINITY_DN80395_c0_g1_i1.p1  ORF type:complete len:280 (-),score=78.22 TRINITY_DN80395_c0_g1_i1:132-971(-)
MPHLLRKAVLLLYLARPIVSDEQEEETEEEARYHRLMQAVSEEEATKILKAADRDQDGYMSVQEALQLAERMKKVVGKEHAQALLKELDTDQDGKLSVEEAHSFLLEWPEDNEEDKAIKQEEMKHEAAKFRLADADNNGFLLGEEIRHFLDANSHEGILKLSAAKTLTTMDADSDGFLSLHEFLGYDDSQMTPDGGSDAKEVFTLLDANDDGKLSEEELKRFESGDYSIDVAMAKMFEVADSDSDGKLSAAEFQAAREALSETKVHHVILEWLHHKDEL